MILYTINGVYPDKNFNFSVTAEDLQLVPELHEHAVEDVDGLDLALEGKADTDHTHICVTQISAGSGVDNSTIGFISEPITGETVTCDITLSGQTVTFAHTSPEIGVAGTFMNQNQNSDAYIIQLSTVADAPIITPAQGHLYMDSRITDFSTQTIEEFVKTISIEQAGQDSKRITRVLLVNKLANGIQSKEVWPIAAVRLHVTTNYDYATGQKRLTDLPYNGPALTKTGLTRTPIQMTVTPYPPDAAWKIGHSDNIADSSSFNTVYRGKQTVTVRFSMTENSDDYQEAWLSVYPVDSTGVADPVYFKFWCQQSEGSGPQEPQEGEQETLFPTHRWTFKDSAAPLVDVIAGKSLETPQKNPSSVASHLLAEGINECYSLKNIQPTVAAHEVILVNNIVYDASSSLDNPTATNAKFAWYSLDQNATVYTAASSPAVGDTVYNADESDTGYTIEEKWTADPNYFESNIDFDESTSPITLSFYMRQNMGYKIYVGDYLGVEGSYSNRCRPRVKCHATDSGTGSNGDLYPTKHDANWYYLFIAYLSEVYEPLNPAHAYTAERGYGFIVSKGLSLHGIGYPYVRDPLKDENGYYAFSWISGGITNNDTTPQRNGVDVPTVWLAVENPEHNWEDNVYTDAGTTSIGKKVAGNTAYKVVFRDDRFTAEPHTQTWMNNKANNAEPFSQNIYVRELVWWENGQNPNIKMSNNYNTPLAAKRRVSVRFDEATAKINAVSDLRVYNRAITSTEITELYNALWGDVVESDASGVDFNPPGALKNNMGLNKIHVGNGWYIYSPEDTVYTGTANDPYAARYGWELISGTGNAKLWTTNYLPTNADFCATTATSTPDTNLRVQQVASIAIADYPLHCKLIPYVIDSKTIAVAIWTHDAIIRIMRTKRPYVEAIMKFSEMGKYDSDSWMHGQERNLAIWDAHFTASATICARADDAANWTVDGNAVTLRAAFYSVPFGFEPTAEELQWRNCKPGDDFYAADPKRLQGSSFAIAPELIQIRYLTLGTAMTPGSTHTIAWCGDTCTIKYGPEQYCATLKVNQEGYMPFAGINRYAYLGRWLGTDSYMPDEGDRTFYIVPSGSTNTADAFYSGTMTQRCIAASYYGLCGDKYGQGSYQATKPLSCENTFELDFSGMDEVTKDKIVIEGVDYFRDPIEDGPSGSITIADVDEFFRDTQADTCNCFAWTRISRVQQPRTVYTSKDALPEVGDCVKLGYDSDPDSDYEISAVDLHEYIGWSTERVDEEDWADYATVWTDKESTEEAIENNRMEHELAYTDLAWPLRGNFRAITSYSAAVTTSDISGKYQVYVPNIGWSHEFYIHPDIMAKQFWTNMRGLFHQRGGCDWVKHPYTNWEHPKPALKRLWEGNFVPFDDGQAKDTTLVWRVDPTTHEPILDDYGSRQNLSNSGSGAVMCGECDKYKCEPLYDVYGGWMDAADYDLRELHLPIINILAGAYLLAPDNFFDGQLDLPESGDGIPDILDEAIHGANLYRRAQRENGGIRAWFETGGDVDSPHVPWKSSAKYYACVESKCMSIQYAGPAARLAMALKLAASRCNDPAKKANIEQLAKTFTESACAAWEYGTSDYYEPWMKTPDAQRTPVYFETQGKTWAWVEWISFLNTDTNVSSGFKSRGITAFESVVSLYALTKESRFKSWITQKAVQNYINAVGSFDSTTAYDMAIEWISMLDDDFPTFAQSIRNSYVAYADVWRGYQATHAYRWHYWAAGSKNTKFGAWGSTHPDKRGMAQVYAWLITGDEVYRNAAINAFDHACGCNPLGRSFVPGVGKLYPVRYLDHWVRWDIVKNGYESPMPGTTPCQGCNYPNEWADLLRTCGLYYNGREWLTGGSIDAFPQLCRQKYNMNKNNWRDMMYFPHLPIFQGPYLFCEEDQGSFIATAEFTVNETIASKAAMTGLLMTPSKNYRPYWKQIDRVKREDNLGRTIILP